jgi:hypothetical protein
MRPSFTASARCRSEDAVAVLRERLDENSQAVEGSFSRKNGVLRVCRENQRFWSPCLDLTIDDASSGHAPSMPPARDDYDEGLKVKVWGTFSPRPEIWTGFVFSIGTALVISLVAVIFGSAQFMLGEAPWALLIPPVALLFVAGIYASALVGQGLSGDDIYSIRAYVDMCLREAEEISRRRLPLDTDSSSQL